MSIFKERFIQSRRDREAKNKSKVYFIHDDGRFFAFVLAIKLVTILLSSLVRVRFK